MRVREREEEKQWKSTTFKMNINQLIGFDHMSIEKRAKEERNPTMLSFQIFHDKNLCCSCIAEIFENLLQAGTMKALRVKTAAHKRRGRRIK